MTKKILIAITILFATLFLSSSVFATNNVQDGARDIGTEVKDSWDKLGGAVQNIGNNAKGAVDNVGNNARNSMNNNNTTANNNHNNNGYTATRTSAVNNNGNLFGMTSNAWTWFIMAVLAVVIVALVWYYGTQTANNKSNRRND